MMLTLLQPDVHEGQNIDTNTPSLTSLLQRFNDLTVKYDALEQKYNTIKLENKEYKSHVDQLEEQNQELTCELDTNMRQIDEEKALTPILTHELASMNNVLHKNDTEIKQLQTKLYTSNSSNDCLSSENIIIKNQNEKFRQILENNIKQKQIQDETIAANQKYINSLETELQRLRDELQTIKSIKCFDLKNTNSNEVKFTLPTECENDAIQTLTFIKTIDDSTGIQLDASGFGASDDNVNDSTQFVDTDTEKQFGAMDSVYENINNNELMFEVQQLKMENMELKKQLENCNNDVDCNKEETKYDTETDGELTENEMAEMETLFEKCNVEIEKELEKQKTNIFMRKFAKVSILASAYR